MVLKGLRRSVKRLFHHSRDDKPVCKPGTEPAVQVAKRAGQEPVRQNNHMLNFEFEFEPDPSERMDGESKVALDAPKLKNVRLFAHFVLVCYNQV